MSMNHEFIEKNIGIMSVLVIFAISLGGLTQMVPLFFQKSVTEPIEGLTPWTALELEGRDIYIRDGCHVCHSQMIRSLRSEVERYGPYSLAGESVYDCGAPNAPALIWHASGGVTRTIGTVST